MMHRIRFSSLIIVGASLAAAAVAVGGLLLVAPRAADPVLVGAAAFGDWTKDAPGVWRKIAAADLPKPFASESTANRSTLAPRPEGALPKVLPGFAVAAFLDGLKTPRTLRVAPNGDIFLAESGAGRIHVIRAAAGASKAASDDIFAEGLDRPFGIAFYPPGPNPRYVYVGTTKSVVRYPYRLGETKAGGPAETIVANIPDGGHWTRDVMFSPDGKKMFLAVGSSSNIQNNGPAAEQRRANILELNPDGSDEHVWASGLRNPVAMTIDPQTGELWTVVNERDLLGDNLPPDYVTHVKMGGFYGWPYYYIGGNVDPRVQGEHSQKPSDVIVPDVLLQPHSAPLGITVYNGAQFPAEYRGDIFVALHGSWNRAQRTGYKLVRVKLKDGHATGEYEDFLTGFVTNDAQVWGRPVSVTVAADGALLMSDDGSGTIWRIAYAGK
jgi:glucose/arabinose dehydrogenase